MSLGSENCAAPLSAADVAAVTGNNGNNGGWGGFGGDWLIAIVILFLFPMMFGGWGGGMFGGMGGWGNGGFSAMANGALTRADLCSEFNFNGLENSVRGIQQGLCDGFYAMNTAVLNGFHGVDNAICTLGYQNAQLINGVSNTVMQGFNAANVVALQNQNTLQAQLANCCCENRTGQMQLGNQMERGFCDVNYGAATNTNAIIQNAHNDTDRVIAKLDAMEMARKDETIQALREKLSRADLAASQAAQNTYLVDQLSPKCPIPAFLTCNPYTGQSYTNGYVYGYNNNGCGCNSGCGCGNNI